MKVFWTGRVNDLLTMISKSGPMPSLTLDGRLIWFAHCPKAGGTSIEQFMVARWGNAVGHLHWGWDRWWLGGGWRVADPPNSPQHLIWEDALRHLPRPPDTVFAVIRDPVDRMASEYRWQRRGRRGRRLGRALAHLPFPLWLRLMLALAHCHPHAFDNHLRPQSDFIPEGTHLFRLEDGLEPVLTWLAAETKLEAPPEIPHALPGGARTPTGPGDAARIAAAHQVDYARFGYPQPDGPLPEPDMADWLAARLAPALAWLDRRGRL